MVDVMVNILCHIVNVGLMCFTSLLLNSTNYTSSPLISFIKDCFFHKLNNKDWSSAAKSTWAQLP